jgi:hypothetical protein
MFICRLCKLSTQSHFDCRNFSSVLSKTYRMWLFSINMDALESRGNTLSTKLVPHPPPHPENSGSMTSILVWCFLHIHRNVVSVNNKEVFTINFEVSWVLGPQFSTKISFDTGSLQTMLNESSVYFELLNLTTTVRDLP